MRKKLYLLPVLLLFLVLIVGCGTKPQGDPLEGSGKPTDGSSVTEPDGAEKDDPTLSLLRESIQENNCTLGIAFIGYVDSESTSEDVCTYLKNSPAAQTYPFLRDSGLVVHEGAELYAFVPASKEASITVYQAGMTDSGEYEDHKDKTICQGGPGEVVVLRCNLSEIYSNVLISATDGAKTLEFHPMLSMKDGHVAAVPGCYDFSVYEDSEDKSIEIARDLLGETDEVQEAMKHGMELLYTGEQQMIGGKPHMLFALGTDHGDQFVREKLYAVSDNLIYAFNTETDQWQVLGTE